MIEGSHKGELPRYMAWQLVICVRVEAVLNGLKQQDKLMEEWSKVRFNDIACIPVLDSDNRPARPRSGQLDSCPWLARAHGRSRRTKWI